MPMMVTVLPLALLSAAVAVLLTTAGVSAGEDGPSACHLSFFRSIPPSVMAAFWSAQTHYIRTHPSSDSGSGSGSLLASTVELRALSLRERKVLVWTEFRLFSAVLGNRTAEGPAPNRRVRESLDFITSSLRPCVNGDDAASPPHSPTLSHLLQRLTHQLDCGDAGVTVGKVLSHLVPLLNEHLPCVAKGGSC